MIRPIKSRFHQLRQSRSQSLSAHAWIFRFPTAGQGNDDSGNEIAIKDVRANCLCATFTAQVTQLQLQYFITSSIYNSFSSYGDKNAEEKFPGSAKEWHIYFQLIMKR